MEKKTKKFDCVEMKRRAQEKLLSEFEENKSQYKSYADFIEQKAKASSVQKKLLARLAKIKKTAVEEDKNAAREI